MIRCDNSPENICHAMTNRAENRGILREYIQPAQPQQSAYIERFNRTVRDVWLSPYLFETVGEVKVFSTR